MKEMSPDGKGRDRNEAYVQRLYPEKIFRWSGKTIGMEKTDTPYIFTFVEKLM